ncbi:hypothetical protein [Arthrobacter pascens]|uniref:hypothetical protein n=1 Tax=Arthrobacter pascens TaxID=1677 RepID=UPI00196B7E36|nr:hypothetical protein [Arthrobacter pascens]MBN3497277.1 hypothetical protein [Arthrobacter pascens]
MTITSPTRRPLAAKLALVSTFSLGLVAGPVALAGPASAAPSHSERVNCWVEAKKPDLIKIHKEGYHKFARVDFSFKIKCDKNVKVHWQQWIVKETKHGYDRIKYRDGDVRVHKNDVVHESTKARVDQDRKEDRVKVLHVVKITFDKDKDGKGKWSRSSDVDKSETLTIRFHGGY